jgi:beta-1,2-mannosidase
MVLAVLLLATQKEAHLPFGPWQRAPETPILAPHGNGWESSGIFNPAVALRGDKIVMLYRAQDKHGTSRLGYAESADGIHFTRRDEPVLTPSEAYEKDGGVEDPRLVQFGDIYYLTYTGYNKTTRSFALQPARPGALGP